ncbi:MAG: phosphoribosylanthranilate isomerase [Christensenellaceae bacterium]|jgi:phosphoribosylanthranilate isomerase|nr:phosphoribosylanthranilate isomerase [Christensenellaceae bacterium]
MISVKICGLMHNSDVDIVNECMPDFVGFIFTKSRREVTPKTAKLLSERLSHSIIPVGVFVDADIDTIKELSSQNIFKMIQLHGNESEDYIKTLKRNLHLPIIKRIVPNVGKGTDYKSSAEFILLDGAHSGSGECLNWESIERPPTPFFLAGGLNVFNVKKGIKALNPIGVDVSSGVESCGHKDREKVKEFIFYAKQY